jgi:hypothetical protein
MMTTTLFAPVKMKKKISRCTTNWCKERVLARAVDLMHRQRSFGRGTLLWVIERSKKITLLQILFTMIISSVEGKILYVANDSYAVPHS